MFFSKPDDYLEDKTGRYEYETIAYYDCPLVYFRYDNREKTLRLISVDHGTGKAVSGQVRVNAYKRFKAGKISGEELWNHAWRFKEDGFTEDGEVLLGPIVEYKVARYDWCPMTDKYYCKE